MDGSILCERQCGPEYDGKDGYEFEQKYEDVYEDEYEFIEASQAWVGKYVSERHESWSGAC